MRKISILLLFFICILACGCAHRSRHKQSGWAEETREERLETREESIEVKEERREVDSRLLLNCSQDGTQLLVRDGYVCLYSLETHCPVYVSWKLTQERVDGEVRRCKAFFADEEVTEEHRVGYDAYKGSGWSRGHMCPAADNKDSELRMRESCLMTNICPQDMGLNNGRWNDLENKCRNLARKGNTVYVYCGPIYYNKEYRWIGNDVRVAVPDAFFKVVKCIDKQGRTKTTAYIFRNEDVDGKLSEYEVEIMEVEILTRILFKR